MDGSSSAQIIRRRNTMASEGATTTSITVHLTVIADAGAPRIPLQLTAETTPSQLRHSVSEVTRIPLAQLKIIFRGQLIAENDQQRVMKDFKLEEGSVLHCMGKPAPMQEAAATTGTATTATTAVSPAAAASMAPTVGSASLPASMIGGGSLGINSTTGPSTHVATGDPVTAALQQLRASNSGSVYQTAVATLHKILSNIVQHPMEEKYRRVKKQNASFSKRLGAVAGGDAAMKAVGFVIELDSNGEDSYMLPASAEAWPRLVAAHQTVEAAAASASAQQPPAASMAPVIPQVGQPSAAVPMDPFSFPPANLPPHLNAAAANLLSNPQALQAMMQNPMVQQMMQNDPRLANNPMMQQAMQEMANNPQMAQQMSQMMSSMMAQGGEPGAGIPNQQLWNAFAQQQQQSTGQQPNTNASNRSSNNSSGASDEEMTEEEMIAEAIRRSLQDG